MKVLEIQNKLCCDRKCSLSVFGKAAGDFTDLPSEEEHWNAGLHPGAGLHGEGVQLRGGQKVLPGLLSYGELAVNSLVSQSILMPLYDD